MGLTPVGEMVNSPVHTGRYGHTYLEVFYKSLQEGKTKEQALKIMQESGKDDINGPSLKGLLAALNFARDRPEDGRPILVEEKIKVFVEEGLEFTFVPDLVWEYTEGPWKGQCSVEDYKFVQRRWSDTAISFYRQVPLYIHYLMENGYPTAKKGILWFINRDTGVSQRRIVTPTKEDLQGFVSEHLKTARRIIKFKNLPIIEQNQVAMRTSNTDQCQKCYFSFPCRLELSGKDISKTLRTGYKEYDRKE
jgi:hypothetical protein